MRNGKLLEMKSATVVPRIKAAVETDQDFIGDRVGLDCVEFSLAFCEIWSFLAE
jgi:hypothetical protein